MLFHEGEEGMKACFKALVQRDVDANPPAGKRSAMQVTSTGIGGMCPSTSLPEVSHHLGGVLLSKPVSEFSNNPRQWGVVAKETLGQRVFHQCPPIFIWIEYL